MYFNKRTFQIDRIPSHCEGTDEGRFFYYKGLGNSDNASAQVFFIIKVWVTAIVRLLRFFYYKGLGNSDNASAQVFLL